MRISFADFDFGFRRLLHAFGGAYNQDRAKMYYEHLENRVEPEIWKRIVTQVIESNDMFPRISTLVSICNRERGDVRRSFDPALWVTDDCKVKNCDGGLLHYETPDGVVCFRCPRCDRADITNKMARYKGAVTLHSDEEMARRRKERQEIHDSESYRTARGIEIAREAVKMFDYSPKKEQTVDKPPEAEEVPFPPDDGGDDNPEADSGVFEDQEDLRMEE